MKKLQIEYLPIEALTPYDGNAKLHPDRQVEQIADSISELGFNDPVAVWGAENIVIEGHGRLLAAQRLGLDKIPVIRLDALSEEQRRAYALVHNKLTMNSGFDMELLQIELESIDTIEMEAFDFILPEAAEEFSMDDFDETPGYDAAKSEKEFFESTFVFPTAYRTQILSYLRQNKARIQDEIVENAIAEE